MIARLLNRQTVLPFLILVSLTVITRAEESKPKVFLAGAATSNITPPLGESIVGNWKPIPATNIHDELHARCLVLDDGENQVGFVVCDSVGIDRDIFDEARELIAKETNFPADHLLMSATHSHSATLCRSETYRPFLVRRIADGVRRAIANMEPARIAWGGVDEPSEVFIRRWYVTDPDMRRNPFGGIDEVRMNPPAGSSALIRPAGIVDPEISFLSVQSKEGRPIALLANYSLHYVGGVKSGDVSADYFSIFADRIAELMEVPEHAPPFVGILSNGTSGDVNNINFKEKRSRQAAYEQMTRVAHLIAQRVAEAHKEAKFQDWVPLGFAQENLTLTRRKPDAEMKAYFDKVRAQPEDAEPYHRHEMTYAERTKALEEGPDEIEALLQIVRIGDLAIGSIPFEVFAEIGLELKEKTPFKDYFTIELANGWEGYLPTPAQHKLGGYETWMGTSRVQKDGSVKIVDTLLGLMKGFKASAKAPKKDGSISLFNGKNLEGWKQTQFGTPAEVFVDKGDLVIEMGSPMNGVTITDEAFKKLPKVNYEITMEAQRELGGDFFVGLTFPVKEEYASLIMGGWGGGVIGISSLDGFDASENETTTYSQFKNGEWYKVKLKVTEKQIQVWLDGEEMIDVDIEDRDLSTRIEVDLSQPLGLAAFQTTARLRNIKMTPIK